MLGSLVATLVPIWLGARAPIFKDLHLVQNNAFFELVSHSVAMFYLKIDFVFLLLHWIRRLLGYGNEQEHRHGSENSLA